ncbi:2-phospho-L-lactate transferase [Georgenia sp. MJ173]|uniref:2-phospho-L-lactate transferase n=1 Tax=Georgenia sunbinii TaxID=3117728 RepID=UPI002F2690BC
MTPVGRTDRAVTLLSGGGGGAKLADGLARATAGLTVVVNTADDAVLYGLSVSPDVDTVMYTLAGRVNPQTGWGVVDETFTTLTTMAALGEDIWFRLGDRDLATHILRTQRLRDGATLSEVTAQLCTALGVAPRVLPMTNDPVVTRVATAAGTMSFQEYFVGRQHRDEVHGISFAGIDGARPAPGVLPALTDADVVVLGPSNPFVSIGPILAVPGVRAALAASSAHRVAVSPIVGGGALKGPAAAMLASLGHEVSPLGVARLYGGLVDTFVLDELDAQLAPAVEDLGMSVLVTRTVMATASDRELLAGELLAAAA